MAEPRAKRTLAEPPEGKASVTPLLRFIRALKDAEKETQTKFFLISKMPQPRESS
jgi:hypothetical protein